MSNENCKMLPISLGSIKEPARRKPLLGGRLVEGAITTLYADGGQGKSLLGLAMATAISSSMPFLGFEMPAGPILYLDFELSLEEQARRAYRVARGMKLPKPPHDLFYLRMSESLPKCVSQIKILIEKYKSVFLILDSFGPACGANPEAASDVAAQFNTLRTLGVSVLLIDHQTKLQEGQDYKKKTPFGSAYKFNLSRSILHLERVESSDKSSKLILRHTKNNFGALCEDLPIVATFGEDIVFSLGDKADKAFASALSASEQILGALQKDGEMTVRELSEKLSLPERTVSNIMPRLEFEKKVSTQGKRSRAKLWGISSNSPQN